MRQRVDVDFILHSGGIIYHVPQLNRNFPNRNKKTEDFANLSGYNIYFNFRTITNLMVYHKIYYKSTLFLFFC